MAEVKVKITAANQTQTGFQSVLADAQKTAAQVQQTFARASSSPRIPRTFSPDPTKVGPVDIGDYGLEPLRKIQEDLRRARESAREVATPKQEGRGIVDTLGRIPVIGAAAAAAGRVLADQFDKVNRAVLDVVSGIERFSSTFRTAVDATSVESAISGFNQLNAISQQTAKTLQGLKMDLGASIANAILGGDPFRELQATADSQRLGAFSALAGSAALQEDIANRQAAVAGNKTEEQALRARLKNEAELRALENLRPLATGSNEKLLLDNAIESTRRRQQTDLRAERDRENIEAQNRFREQQRKQQEAAAKQAEREAQELQRQITGGREFGPGTVNAARGGFRVDAANFALQQQQEALRIAQQQAQQSGVTGSFGASALQRIGGASTEFFDTRRRATPEDIAKEVKRNADFTKQVVDILKKGEPLVLSPSS